MFPLESRGSLISTSKSALGCVFFSLGNSRVGTCVGAGLGPGRCSHGCDLAGLSHMIGNNASFCNFPCIMCGSRGGILWLGQVGG